MIRLQALLLGLGAAVALAACGSGGGGSASDLPGNNGSPGAAQVASSGCTGCHRIGNAGGGGPGPELTHIGSELSRSRIASVLVSPPDGMPSFASKSAADRRAIVDYLVSLK